MSKLPNFPYCLLACHDAMLKEAFSALICLQLLSNISILTFVFGYSLKALSIIGYRYFGYNGQFRNDDSRPDHRVFA
jgi:hypothetical protein